LTWAGPINNMRVVISIISLVLVLFIYPPVLPLPLLPDTIKHDQIQL